ncbi:hypothetical protein [Nocardioides marmoriginsengisoli]|uniref:hypothetical protein n=1 Tax=Nocardioides marmoriginsengisoli TaxID=661483 RepID=UPI0011CD7F3E|nr:hypothetical protein [Nocardioides marmoriginsengisoli]
MTLFEGGRRRTIGVLCAGFLVMELFAYAVAGILVGGGNEADREAVVAQLRPLGLQGVLSAPGAQPKKLEEPRGMGSEKAGVAVLALSEVDAVKTSSGTRRAPEGSRLLAFRLGDWVCEVEPCEGWRSVAPRVDVDGSYEDLPAGTDTFVVVLPPGTQDVRLDMDADGFDQSLSLLDDSAGEGNIALLAQKDQTERVPLNRTFRVIERTSVPLQNASGQVSDTFTRDVTVEFQQRRFFLDGLAPSSPRRVFLIVNAYYSYAGQTQKYVPVDEVTFVDKKGRSYPGRDLDPDASVALVGFEIPADVRAGVFRMGGSRTKVSTNGQSYTSTLGDAEIPITLR